jgi:hypothetical protein
MDGQLSAHGGQGRIDNGIAQQRSLSLQGGDGGAQLAGVPVSLHGPIVSKCG